MIKHTYENYGAQFLITMSGEPETLSRTVNKYCNHGMFQAAAIPETFKAGESNRVTVPATKTNVMPALLAMAQAALIHAQAKLPREQRVKGEMFEAVTKAEAATLFATFEKVKPVLDEPKKANESEYKLDAEDDAEYLRKVARRMFSVINRSKRDSAKSTHQANKSDA